MNFCALVMFKECPSAVEQRKLGWVSACSEGSLGMWEGQGSAKLDSWELKRIW